PFVVLCRELRGAVFADLQHRTCDFPGGGHRPADDPRGRLWPPDETAARRGEGAEVGRRPPPRRLSALVLGTSRCPAMTSGEIALVQESFRKLAPISDSAIALFYARWFELDPGLRHFCCGAMTVKT